MRWKLPTLLLFAAAVTAIAHRRAPRRRQRPAGPGELRLAGPFAPQSVTICQPAAATDGRVVVMDTRFPPGARRPPDHWHPEQEEQLELLSGALRARVGGRERVLVPGDVLVVPPGTRHAVWNDGHAEARAIRQLHPALEGEALMRELADALAAPAPRAAWRVAELLRVHRRELRLDTLATARALAAALAQPWRA